MLYDDAMHLTWEITAVPRVYSGRLEIKPKAITSKRQKLNKLYFALRGLALFYSQIIRGYLPR